MKPTELTPCSTSTRQPVAGADTQRVWRYRPKQGLAEVTDALATEAPLEIRVQGKAVCVTMRTPDRTESLPDDARPHDHELAAGFLLSEGVIRDADDIDNIAHCSRSVDGNIVNVFLNPSVSFDASQLTRHVFASSSCGICGKATIDAILADLDPLDPPLPGRCARVSTQTLAGLPERLHSAQPVFGQTGGLHAAAVFDMDGRLLTAREDIGRHNAVDKVLGHLLMLGRLPLGEHVLVVSGRASFEIMQKALAARVPIVAAVSAPSSLAVDFATDSGQTLAGFVRGGGFNLYSHQQRVLASD